MQNILIAYLNFIKIVAKEQYILSKIYEATERVLLFICFENFDHHLAHKGGSVPHLQKNEG